MGSEHRTNELPWVRRPLRPLAAALTEIYPCGVFFCQVRRPLRPLAAALTEIYPCGVFFCQVRRPLRPLAAVLTEIYRCGVWFCQEIILRRNGHGQANSEAALVGVVVLFG
eukprot:COSAG01_NODE_1017_length_12107_cov_114.566372_14_plen_111_part_00